MERLISLREYVLEQKKEFDKDGSPQRLNLIFNYAKFLKQPLTLGMFIPVGEDGNVLEEPNETTYMLANGKHQYEEIIVQDYKEALSKVLFKGFEVEEHEPNNFSIRCENNILNVMWKFENQDWRPAKGIYTIEDLVKYNLELTPNAINQ